METTDNESGEQAEWVVVGPDKDENKRDQYWTVERKGYPYGLDGKGNRLDPFGTFTSRIWAQQTADFANALEARAARVTQLETALQPSVPGYADQSPLSVIAQQLIEKSPNFPKRIDEMSETEGAIADVACALMGNLQFLRDSIERIEERNSALLNQKPIARGEDHD